MSDPALRLRGAGLRVTRSRLAILGLLEELGGHHSADELVEAFRSGGSPIPRATVYHVIETLGRTGLVLVAASGPGRTLYEWAADWHHHLVCRGCGRIVDVPCLTDVKPCLSPVLPGAVVEEAQVIFRGLCAVCATNRARATPGPPPAESDQPPDEQTLGHE